MGVNPKHVHDNALAALEQDEDDLETLKKRYKWLQVSRMKLLCDLVFVCKWFSQARVNACLLWYDSLRRVQVPKGPRTCDGAIRFGFRDS